MLVPGGSLHSLTEHHQDLAGMKILKGTQHQDQAGMKILKGTQHQDQASMKIFKSTQYQDHQAGMICFKNHPIPGPGWHEFLKKSTQYQDVACMKIFKSTQYHLQALLQTPYIFFLKGTFTSIACVILVSNWSGRQQSCEILHYLNVLVQFCGCPLYA
jgi:hypothetical protein